MQPKLLRYFTDSAAALLAALAAAMFISNFTSARFTLPRDPLFMASMRVAFWGFGTIELVVALVCLFGKRLQVKLVLVLWLATNLFIYQIGFLWTGNHRGLGGYLGSLDNAFGTSPGTAYLLVKTVALYLLLGSSIALFCLWKEDAKGYLKSACVHCGGHITFLPNALGQQIACPHCRAAITLRRPGENLKMTCVLCGGRVEFPAHALKQKIPCPHCAKTITLLEPV